MSERDALNALAAILAGPDFARPTVSLWQLLLDALLSLVRDFLDWLSAPAHNLLAGRVTAIEIAACALALALLGAVAWFVARVVSFSVVREGAIGGGVARERRERSDALWRQAQDFAAGGQLADAVRSLYLSALYALDEHDLLHVEAALTNREHAERLQRAQPRAGGLLAEVVQTYEPLRYGGHPVTAGAYDALQRLVGELRAEA
ncbi:MAG: DUF4129 domain-containing protein [Chloroflexi bacterium]|nr:DUF4129 domain-containing protein [Chloroflexota bacterium]